MIFAKSILFELIEAKQWAEALQRVESHKAEVFKLRKCTPLTDSVMKCVKVHPLHIACFLRAPLYLVLALIKAFPRAVRITDTGYRRLPIHHATMSRGHPEVVLELIRRYPESVAVLDSLRRLPLHYALFTKMPVAVIEEMVRIHPQGIKAQDCKGFTPLHLAGAAGAPISVMRMLVFACPEALELRDRCGLSVRDFCILHQSVSKEVIQFLSSSNESESIGTSEETVDA
jgi:hypothetical protein